MRISFIALHLLTTAALSPVAIAAEQMPDPDQATNDLRLMAREHATLGNTAITDQALVYARDSTLSYVRAMDIGLAYVRQNQYQEAQVAFLFAASLGKGAREKGMAFLCSASCAAHSGTAEGYRRAGKLANLASELNAHDRLAIGYRYLYWSKVGDAIERQSALDAAAVNNIEMQGDPCAFQIPLMLLVRAASTQVVRETVKLAFRNGLNWRHALPWFAVSNVLTDNTVAASEPAPAASGGSSVPVVVPAPAPAADSLHNHDLCIRVYGEVVYRIQTSGLFGGSTKMVTCQTMAAGFLVNFPRAPVTVMTAAHLVDTSPPRLVGLVDGVGDPETFLTKDMKEVTAVSVRLRVGPAAIAPESVSYNGANDTLAMRFYPEHIPALGGSRLSFAVNDPTMNSRATVCGFPTTVAPQITNDPVVTSLASGHLVLNKPMDPGYSGGPILNQAGEVVGMLVRTTVNQSIGVALVPLRQVVAQYDKTMVPYLDGMHGSALTKP